MANGGTMNDAKDDNKDRMPITDIRSGGLPQSTQDTEGGKQSSQTENLLHPSPDAKDQDKGRGGH